MLGYGESGRSHVRFDLHSTAGGAPSSGRSVADFLFVFWMLSLPFGIYSVWSTYSIDNLIAPCLLVVALFAKLPGTPAQTFKWLRTVGVGVVLLLVYALGQTLPLIGDDALSNFEIRNVGKHCLYALLPLLFIRDPVRVRRSQLCLVLVTIMGGVSALLASVGAINLPVVRFEQSRIGIEGVQKAIGLFASYGDLAILAAFSTACIAFSSRTLFHPLLVSRIFRGVTLLAILAGIAGCQSRSVLLSVGLGMCAGLVGSMWGRASQVARLNFLLASLVVGLVTALFALSNFGEIVARLAAWGGEGAQGTAMDRLRQYDSALDLLKGRYWLGISASEIAVHANSIFGIHNFWLRGILTGGVFGIVTTVAPLVWALVYAIGFLTRERVRPQGVVILSTLAAILTATQFYPGGTLLYWVVTGCLLAMRNADPSTEEIDARETVGASMPREQKYKNLLLR